MMFYLTYSRNNRKLLKAIHSTQQPKQSKNKKAKF